MRWASALAKYLSVTAELSMHSSILPYLMDPVLISTGSKNHAHRQTLTFYVHLGDRFYEVLKTGKKEVRILDVGSGSGIGAELLAVLLSNALGINAKLPLTTTPTTTLPMLAPISTGLNLSPGQSRTLLRNLI